MSLVAVSLAVLLTVLPFAIYLLARNTMRGSGLSRMAEASEREMIMRMGPDLSGPAALQFTLLFDSVDVAGVAAAAFPAPEWHTTVQPSSRSGQWALDATIHAVPAADVVAGHAARCQQVAEAGGGEYEGMTITVSSVRDT